MDLSILTLPEINDMREKLNLTSDEEIIFNYLCKGKTVTQIADRLNVSNRTVDNRIRRIRRKIEYVGGLDNE